jgi:hypothetical protein
MFLGRFSLPRIALSELLEIGKHVYEKAFSWIFPETDQHAE